MSPVLQYALAAALTVVLVVLLVLRRATGRPRDLLAPDRSTGEAPGQAQVLQLIREQRTIEAITVLRRQTGLPLREAKQVVDLLAGGAPPPPATRGGPAGMLDDEVRTTVAALAHTGKKIQAIKLVREHTRLSLADAKRYVESL